MLDTWSHEEVSEGGQSIPNGRYCFEIEKFETREAKNGKAMITGNFRVIEPKSHKGIVVRENFVIGTEDDPGADDPKSVAKTVGISRYKRLLKKAGVPITGKFKKEFAAAKGVRFISLVEETKDGKYTNNSFVAYYALGEAKPGLIASNGTDDDDDDDVPPKTPVDDDEED